MVRACARAVARTRPRGNTGIRKAELHRLDLADVDLESRQIHIRHGKGRKQRVVAFGDAPCEALVAHITRFRGQDTGALFLSVSREKRDRHSVNPDHLSTLLERLGKQAGVHANAHRFRHTFATWAIENQAREIDVQYLLGHSTSAMVRRYSATYDAAKAAEAHATFSPASRLSYSHESTNDTGTPATAAVNN